MLRWIAREAHGKREPLQWALDETSDDGSLALATLQKENRTNIESSQ